MEALHIQPIVMKFSASMLATFIIASAGCQSAPKHQVWVLQTDDNGSRFSSPKGLIEKPPTTECVASPAYQKVGWDSTADISVRIVHKGLDTVLITESNYPLERWKIECTHDGTQIGYSVSGRRYMSQFCDPSVKIRKLAPYSEVKQVIRLSDLFDISAAGIYRFHIGRYLLVPTQSGTAPFGCFADATVERQ